MADSIKVRIAVGLSLIGGITGLCALDHWSGRAYGAVAISVALTVAGLREFARMATAGGAPLAAWPLAAAGGLYVLLAGLARALDPGLASLPPLVALAYFFGVGFQALRGEPSQARFHALGAAALGFLYLPVLASFALDCRFLPGVGEAAFFYVIAISKGTDICAYFAGKLLGKTKLIPSVSPGKTVAGFVGALAGGVAITALFLATTSLGEVLPLPLAPGVGIVMALVVVSGDLIESFMKRAVAVKDSAALLPNFGGVLDVIDSILVSAPTVYFLLALGAWLARQGIL